MREAVGAKLRKQVFEISAVGPINPNGRYVSVAGFKGLGYGPDTCLQTLRKIPCRYIVVALKQLSMQRDVSRIIR